MGRVTALTNVRLSAAAETQRSGGVFRSTAKLGVAIPHSTMAATMRREIRATLRFLCGSFTRKAAAPQRRVDLDNCDADRTEPLMSRATAMVMDSSAGSAHGFEP